MYIHERKEWPNFKWDQIKLSDLLAEVRYLQGRLLGRMEALGFELSQEAMLQTLTEDALKTSEIEGEKLDDKQVRSSIAKKLGIDTKTLQRADRDVEGIVEIMLDATENYNQPLTKERLWKWHTALFPTSKNTIHKITVGNWHTKKSGIMKVVSGAHGREKIHYEAPSYIRLKKEMADFIQWFNKAEETDLVIKSALAHFWFVTIHPFDDGNGRMARAIADMVLARSEKSQKRFYSMSSQIQREREDYYNILEKCQKDSLDITPWIKWYLNCLKRAIYSSEKILQIVFTKSEFWNAHRGKIFNERQRIIINRLLDGFVGKLNSSKWAKITKCSQDTALRDISDLLKRQILEKEESGGRSTSYKIKK